MFAAYVKAPKTAEAAVRMFAGESGRAILYIGAGTGVGFSLNFVH